MNRNFRMWQFPKTSTKITPNIMNNAQYRLFRDVCILMTLDYFLRILKIKTREKLDFYLLNINTEF